MMKELAALWLKYRNVIMNLVVYNLWENYSILLYSISVINPSFNGYI
jgi:ABC-type tungstate transport system permease subunit